MLVLGRNLPYYNMKISLLMGEKIGNIYLYQYTIGILQDTATASYSIKMQRRAAAWANSMNIMGIRNSRAAACLFMDNKG